MEEILLGRDEHSKARQAEKERYHRRSLRHAKAAVLFREEPPHRAGGDDCPCLIRAHEETECRFMKKSFFLGWNHHFEIRR